MTPESMGHDLTRNDPADQPRCPMEALEDRFNATPTFSWLRVHAVRWPDAMVYAEIDVALTTPSQLDDLIAFLQEVRG